jgi:hypothetical protein
MGIVMNTEEEYINKFLQMVICTDNIYSDDMIRISNRYLSKNNMKYFKKTIVFLEEGVDRGFFSYGGQFVSCFNKAYQKIDPNKQSYCVPIIHHNYKTTEKGKCLIMISKL